MNECCEKTEQKVLDEINKVINDCKRYNGIRRKGTVIDVFELREKIQSLRDMAINDMTIKEAESLSIAMKQKADKPFEVDEK